MNYVRFSNRADALTLLHAINDHANMPLIGYINGILAPDSQRTLRWANNDLIECVDGKYAIPAVTSAFFDRLGVSQAQRDSIRDTYITSVGATIEEYDPAWVVDEDTLVNIISEGTITASSENGINVATNIQNIDPTSYWEAGGADPQWIQILFPTPRTLVGFGIQAGPNSDDTYNRFGVGFPRDFMFGGSANGVSWTPLRTFVDERFSPREVVKFRLVNQSAYRGYRLQITKTAPNGNATLAAMRVVELAQ